MRCNAMAAKARAEDEALLDDEDGEDPGEGEDEADLPGEDGEDGVGDDVDPDDRDPEEDEQR